MTDKTREDFEAWAMQFNPRLLINFGRGPTVHGQMAYAGYQAATQHSAARIAELEAEVQALREANDTFARDFIAGDTSIDSAIEAERAKP